MMADYSLGVSLLKREDETLYDYMLSFSPLAPFFGVPFRFGGPLNAMEPVARTAEAAPAKTPAPKPAAPKAPKSEVAAPAPAKAPAAKTPEAAPESAPKPAPAAKAEPEAAPQAEAPAGEAPALIYDAAPEGADDLTRIKGVGPKLAAELNGMGVYTFAQIAAMTEANLAWIDSNLTGFRGRSVRDDWVGQASELLGA